MNKRIIISGAAIAIGIVGIGIYLGAASSFDPALQPIGNVAQPAIDGRDISDGQRTAWRTDYYRADWSGNIFAVPVNADGSVDNNNADWDRNILDSQSYDTDRIIFTRNGSSGVPFRYGSLSSVQQASLDASSSTAQKILNYVRGNQSDEAPAASAFRERNSVLGAIIHSTPRYFYNGTHHRVYVGANDGMLHAFDAYTGKEEFAYVPSFLVSKLKLLKADPYTFTYFVDGQQAIARSLTFSGSDHDVLVGTVGAGGQGIYALDITNPNPANEAAAASMSLWEVTSSTSGFANLGYTYGTPVFGSLNNGNDAVFISNGYLSSSGLATLFVINPSNGSLIREISTGAGTSSNKNGLSSPTPVDSDNDGDIDYVYAGDLDGSVWKFNLTSSSPSAWSASRLFTTNPVQPITIAPAVWPRADGGRMVAFGTGRMLLTSDKTDNSVHYVYGIWDGAPSANNALLSQTLTGTAYVNQATNASVSVRVATMNAPTWTSGSGNHYGWKVALPAGERVLGDGTFIEGGRYYFTSTNPTITNSLPPNGALWLNQLNYLTGGSTNSPIYNLNGDTVVDNDDRIHASGKPILTYLGVPVSKYLRAGLSSQPILVSQATLDDTLLTFNPDSEVIEQPVERGVYGGHFDVDIFYPTSNTSDGVSNKTATSVRDGTFTMPPAQSGLAFSYSSSNRKVTITFNNHGLETGDTVNLNFSASNNRDANYTVTRDDVNRFSVTLANALSPTTGTVTVTRYIATIALNNHGLVAGNTVSLNFSSSNMYDNNYTVRAVPGTNTFSVSLTGSPGGTAVSITSSGTIDTCIVPYSTANQCTSTGGMDYNGSFTNNTSGANINADGTSRRYPSNIPGFKFHIHQYDDIYDVTGVDFLFPSARGGSPSGSTPKQLSMMTDLPSTVMTDTTKFKILVSNQYFNPAVTLNVGNAGPVSVKDFGGQTLSTFSIANAPAYTRRTANGGASPIGTFELAMPLDTFASKNYWTSPASTELFSSTVNTAAANYRAGLLATSALCVITDVRGSSAAYPQLNGAIHNGAITVQVVKDTTSQNDIQLNVAGYPEMGWRVKDSARNLILVEYAIYWHMPNAHTSTHVTINGTRYGPVSGAQLCSNNANWRKSSPQETSSTVTGRSPALDASDPVGNFTVGRVEVGRVTTVDGSTSTTVITYSDGSTRTIVITDNNDGTTTTTTTDCPPGSAGCSTTTTTTANPGSSIGEGGEQVNSPYGRLSWRDL